MLNIDLIIDQFYSEEDEALRDILLTHSRLVAERALAIAARHPELSLDIAFVRDAALLHDIGICRVAAPAIHCHGREPYIRHGLLGAEMLLGLASEQEGLKTEVSEEFTIQQATRQPLLSRDYAERLARVCARHTGSGITAEEIIAQGLPLPPIDLLPETLEEKLVCYADAFFSKTRPTEEKPLAHVRRSLSRFGAPSLQRFDQLHSLFGNN